MCVVGENNKKFYNEQKNNFRHITEVKWNIV